MNAQVFDFPTPRRSCFQCAHYVAEASRCALYDEPIESELEAARHCPGFETPQDEGRWHGTDQ
jgi:hypothetical protein